MPRYIDAEELKEEWIDEDRTYYLGSAFVSSIDEQPTADVVEVRHGKWEQKAWVDEEMEVHEDVLVTKCSECGMRTDWLKGQKLWNFCPNCGAKMKGDE